MGSVEISMQKTMRDLDVVRLLAKPIEPVNLGLDRGVTPTECLH